MPPRREVLWRRREEDPPVRLAQKKLRPVPARASFFATERRLFQVLTYRGRRHRPRSDGPRLSAAVAPRNLDGDGKPNLYVRQTTMTPLSLFFYQGDGNLSRRHPRLRARPTTLKGAPKAPAGASTPRTSTATAGPKPVRPTNSPEVNNTVYSQFLAPGERSLTPTTAAVSPNGGGRQPSVDRLGLCRLAPDLR